ncbi:MAG: hypothetical protein A4E35_01690 [Methanoregula sp. PtaU1.Bin051]|nr:MAG: hypothetical protein A4E35_01690 [Methanoregula sp. PtaU1.Bin051]
MADFFLRMNEHGLYHQDLPDDECRSLARGIKEYENAFLTHQISFVESIHDYFTVNSLWHDQEMYNR